MKIETKNINCIEVFALGVSLGLFREIETWNGLVKYERLNDQAMLITSGPTQSGLDLIFDRIFASGKNNFTIGVSASPGLIDEIQEAKRKAIPTAEPIADEMEQSET